MPTPSTQDLPTAPTTLDSLMHRSLHATCPPEEDRPSARLPRLDAAEVNSEEDVSSEERSQDQNVAPVTAQAPADGLRDQATSTIRQIKEDDTEMSRDTPSPATIIEEVKQDAPAFPIASPPVTFTPFAPPFDNSRIPSIRPTQPKYSSSFLRPGSKFEGTQQSDRQVYNVEVEIKYVDMAESFICGYLRIEGLTQDHPSLTTYFQGEIIGNKYTFTTGHSEWGSSEKVDMQHWNRFPAFRPLSKQSRKPDFSFKNFADREYLFMRWKEDFLVPDHKVRTISGASFEGFYYICFNQMTGSVSGIYFHSKSEKFQQLELKHVNDHGCMGAMEFR